MAHERVAVCSRDAGLIDHVRRLAAVAGVEVDVAASEVELRRCWRTARAVVVDADVAATVAGRVAPRRDRVVVTGRPPFGAEVWRHALALGARDVVALPDDERLLLEHLLAGAADSDAARCVVGFLAGHGGAGASTLAMAFGVASSARHRTALVDADVTGAGLELLVGAESHHGLRWPDLAGARGTIDPDELAASLPATGDLRLLSCDRRREPLPSAATVEDVLAALARRHDVVVVDAARGPDPASVAALGACSVVVVVTAPGVRQVAAAAHAIAHAADLVGDVRVVVRRSRHARLRPREVADVLGRPLLGVVDHVGGVPEAADQGALGRLAGRGPLAAWARRAVADLASAPESPI